MSSNDARNEREPSEGWKTNQNRKLREPRCRSAKSKRNSEDKNILLLLFLPVKFQPSSSISQVESPLVAWIHYVRLIAWQQPRASPTLKRQAQQGTKLGGYLGTLAVALQVPRMDCVSVGAR